MNTRQIYTVGKEDKGLTSCAEKVGAIFYPHNNRQIANLANSVSLYRSTQRNFQSFVFLGHANTEAFGGYNAEQFAKQVSLQFANIEDKKILVEDFYLIACDAGLIQEDGTSLAQNIANELHKVGFIKAKVHSISPPEGVVGESLFVGVLERRGIANFISDAREGYINAYLFNKEDAETYFKLFESGNKKITNTLAIEEYKKNRALVIVKDANPHDVLDEPHNIFIPHEKLSARNLRVAGDPQTHSARQQKAALDLLNQRLEYLKQRNPHDDLILKLTFIITKLHRARPNAWQNLIKQNIPYLTVKILGLTCNKTSNTLKLLTHLGHNEFTEAKAIIAKQGKKKKSTKTKITNLLTPHNPSIQDGSGETKHLLDISPKHKIQLVPLDEDTHADVFNQAKREISTLIHHLTNEIAELRNSCCPFFNEYEITTKTQKLSALFQLQQAKSWNELQINALVYVNDARVMRSNKTTRMRDLIHSITQNSESLVQKADITRERYNIN